MWLLVLLLLHWSGHDHRWPLAFLINFLPFFFVPVFALLAAALLLHARLAVVAALPLTLAGLALLLPPFLPKPSFAASGDSLHLISFNVSDTNTEMDSVVGWLRQQRADVILLQEVSAEWFGPFDAQLHDLYPYQVHQLTERGRRGNLTLSRFPVILVPSVPVGALAFQPVILDLDGLPTAFYNVSLATPVDDVTSGDLRLRTPLLDLALRYDDRERNTEIRKLAAQIDTETPPYIVAGDFNMSDQSSIYDTLAARMTDSFREAGTGLGLTWPAFPAAGLPSILPALIRMDYIWHSDGLRAMRAYVGPYLGSDHLPVDVMLDVALTATD